MDVNWAGSGQQDVFLGGDTLGDLDMPSTKWGYTGVWVGWVWITVCHGIG